MHVEAVKTKEGIKFLVKCKNGKDSFETEPSRKLDAASIKKHAKHLVNIIERAGIELDDDFKQNLPTILYEKAKKANNKHHKVDITQGNTIQLHIRASTVYYDIRSPEGEMVYPLTVFRPETASSRTDLKRALKLVFPQLEKDEIERIVLNTCLAAQKLLEKNDTQPDKDKQSEEPINTKEALEILRDNDLMGRILKFLDNSGYKHDITQKKLLIYTGLSAYTPEPLNLFLNAPSGAGKSFGALIVANLFPNVWKIGRMSPTALIHSRGTWNEKKSCLTIDLSNKVIIFLETVSEQLIEQLLPILSHDSEEIEYKITEKSKRGNIIVKNVVIRGFPAVVFCSSRLGLLDDIKTRSLVATPEISPDKTLAANIAYAQRFMSPNNDEVDEEEEKIKAALRLLAKEGGKVLIPYAEALAKVFPQNSHEEMRNFKKLLSLIYLNAFLYKYQRPKLKIGDEEFILATKDDYKAAVDVFDDISRATRTGVPEHVFEFYGKVLKEIKYDSERYKSKIIKKYVEVFKRPIGSSTYSNYINILEQAGLCWKEPDEVDRRKKIIKLSNNLVDTGSLKAIRLKEIFSVDDFTNWLQTISGSKENVSYWDIVNSYVKFTPNNGREVKK